MMLMRGLVAKSKAADTAIGPHEHTSDFYRRKVLAVPNAAKVTNGYLNPSMNFERCYSSAFRTALCSLRRGKLRKSICNVATLLEDAAYPVHIVRDIARNHMA
jgi:hypothetical protein